MIYRKRKIIGDSSLEESQHFCLIGEDYSVINSDKVFFNMMFQSRLASCCHSLHFNFGVSCYVMSCSRVQKCQAI